MAFHSLDLDIAFDVMSGVVALLVSSYAFRYNRLLENSTLKFISIGFIMLGAGLLIESWSYFFVVFGVGDLATDRAFTLITAAMYQVLQLGAFFIFALGYLRDALSSRKSDSVNAATLAAAVFPILSTGPGRFQQMLQFAREVWIVAEILSILFVGIVIVVGFLSYSATRHRFSLFVMLSFLLIFLAQIFDLWTVLSISVRLDLVGSAIQFAGFLSLLVFLIWRGKIGSTRKAPQ